MDDTNTTSVTTTGDHAQVASVEFDMIGDVTGLNVQDDGVVHFDVRVGVSDGTCVVGDNKWNALTHHLEYANLPFFMTDWA